MRRITWILVAVFSLQEPDVRGLIEVPAPGSRENTMAILYTGDGGWRTTDRGLAHTLANGGIPVVAVNTLHYFWTRRTPETAAEDLVRVLTYYSTVWRKEKVIVIGYSYGADVLPFIMNRLPESALSRVEMVVLLAPTQTADFKFHIWQWIFQYTPKKAKPVLPELEKLRGRKILTFCGDQDGESLCRSIPPGTTKIVMLHGGHRLDKFYRSIAKDILKEAK